MQKKLLALSVLMLLSVGCHAMDDSDSSSESSESLPAADTMANDILVNIKNLDALVFVKKSFAMGGIHALLRGGFAEKPHSMETDYKLLKQYRDGIALCRILERFEKMHEASREIIIPRRDRGGYIRFTAQAPFSLRNAAKLLMKSGYVTEIITDNVASRVSQCGAQMEFPVLSPVIPFIARADAYEKRTDFLLSIESAAAAQWLTEMLDQNNCNVSQWRRNNHLGNDIAHNEEWFRKKLPCETLCRAIEKVTRRFHAARAVIKIPGHEGMFLKLTMPQQENVHEVTGILARSPYITQVVIDDCDGYIARRQREIAAQPQSTPPSRDPRQARSLEDFVRMLTEHAQAHQSSAAGRSSATEPDEGNTSPADSERTRGRQAAQGSDASCSQQ